MLLMINIREKYENMWESNYGLGLKYFFRPAFVIKLSFRTYSVNFK